MSVAVSDLDVGQELVSTEYSITRESLVRYAGVSGDFNPIHYRDDVARSVGLPGVLAHGMLTMGIAIQPLVDWCGSAYVLQSYQVRFTKPVVVDPVDGASLSVRVVVGSIEEGDDQPPRIRCDLEVTSQTGEKVLGKAQAVISPA
jgi:acyl dehydratase